MSAANSFECGSCGAPTDQAQSRCGYCGKRLRSDAEGPAQDSAASVTSWISTGAGEFGVRHTLVLSVMGLIAVALYGLGWYFEETRYWLDSRAVTIWAVLLPLWLAIVSFALRAYSGTWPIAVLATLMLWLTHSGIMALVRGRISDDHIGIGGAFALASLAGWLLGRGMHLWFRYSRIQAQRRKHD